MIQRVFDAERTSINLNNGGVSPAPTHVLERMVRDLRFVNELPAVHNGQILEPRMESPRRDVAAEFGCDPEELAIVRNASEALETMILGIDLKRGDEVIITNQNYARMVTTWKQRARRDGIVVREVSFPVPLTDPGVLVRAIEAAITPRTRAIELPHITNLTGQVLPIRDIVRLARPHGIQVFVDGGMPSPTCRSSATIWSATTAPPRCTSGCMRRSARVSCTCAATGFRCCGC